MSELVSGHSDHQSSFRSRWIVRRLAAIAEWFALICAVLTVCSLPWLLGGAIPLARVALLIGAGVATVFGLLAGILSRRIRAGIPVTAVLAIGISLSGVIQLLPIFPPVITGMHRAVHAELRPAIEFNQSQNADDSGMPRSGLPADTRLGIVQWLCLSMLALVAAQVVTTRHRLLCCLSVLTLNACAISVVGLLQQFGDGSMMFGAHWIRYESTPFAAFTNANNAAGWLGIHLAAAVSLMLLVWGPPLTLPYSRLFREPTISDRIWALVHVVQSRLAVLNNTQILASSAVMLILLAILSTLSRSGIVAAVFGLLAACSFRLSWRSAMLMLIPAGLVLTGCVFLLRLFALDEVVVTELGTLQNPVQQAAGRLDHWGQVLHSLSDFPLLGLGMNSYRVSTLPYVRSSADKWFQHADNQFVEMLVETGFTGGILFLAVWPVVLFAGIRLNQAAEAVRGRERVRLLALGLLAIMVTFVQVIAACFDYGPGLPAASSAVMLLSGILVAQYSRSADRRPEVRVSRSRASGAERTSFGVIPTGSQWPVVMLQLSLLVAGSCFFSDLLTAHRIHQQVLAAERALAHPVSQSGLSDLPHIEQELRDQLRWRPDDADGRRAIIQIQEARFRYTLMAELEDLTSLTERDFSRAWRALTPAGLAGHLVRLDQPATSNQAGNVRAIIESVMREYPWAGEARELLEQMPLIPGLAASLVCAEILSAGEGISEPLLLQVIFSEPAASRRLFQAGFFALSRGRDDLAMFAWNESLAASEECRGEIVSAACSRWTQVEAVELFGSDRYDIAVRLAVSIKDRALRELIWQHAENLWQEIGNSLDASNCGHRATQLLEWHGIEVATDWLKECVDRYPEDLRLTVMHARSLEKLGQSQNAMTAWMHVQYFHPRNREASRAIERLGGTFGERELPFGKIR